MNNKQKSKKKKQTDITFQYGDVQYKRSNSKSSPYYLKTAKKQGPSHTKMAATNVLLTDLFYKFVYSNQTKSYTDRKQQVFENRPYSGHFLEPADCSGNPKEVQYSLNQLIDQLLRQLQDKPDSLKDNADFLRRVVTEEGYKIRYFVSFEQVSGWEEFLSVLAAIKEVNLNFRFELLAALILQYADKIRAF